MVQQQRGDVHAALAQVKPGTWSFVGGLLQPTMPAQDSIDTYLASGARVDRGILTVVWHLLVRSACMSWGMLAGSRQACIYQVGCAVNAALSP